MRSGVSENLQRVDMIGIFASDTLQKYDSLPVDAES